jgi:hypothetical protein
LQLPKSEKGGIPSFVIKKGDSLSAIFIFAPEARELLLAEYLYLDRATAERDAGYVACWPQIMRPNMRNLLAAYTVVPIDPLVPFTP